MAEAEKAGERMLKGLSCPIPIKKYPKIVLAHGGGGTLMRDLIEKMFLTAFGTEASDLSDAAVLKDIEPGARTAFTTDSFVVNPLFFPGGNIGRLAVFGTVNDLSTSGAVPKYLSCGFILEEGLDMELLWQIVVEMKQAADEAGVKIVTGDTKVVEKGKGDGIYINTAGIGIIPEGIDIRPSQVKPGDVLLISGDLGRHGVAVMKEREGLEFEGEIESDLAPLNKIIEDLIRKKIDLRCLRDLTRGGLSSAANELALSSGTRFFVEEDKVAVQPEVKGICEILGFDPLYVANEGRFLAILPEAQAEKALEIIKKYPQCPGAAVIGKVEEKKDGVPVVLKSKIGTNRILDMLTGEQLPRIC